MENRRHPTGMLAVFHFLVYFRTRLCIVSTYSNFAIKNKDTQTGILIFYMMMGFEQSNATVRWTVAREG